MTTLVTIGDFAQLSHLSVKALRHYHAVGVLTPATVDPDTGYRRYDTDQVADAHLIRRLRDLDMPLEGVRAVVDAPVRDVRDRLIAEHLERMEAELDRTREVVGSLRAMLGERPPDLPVSRRGEARMLVAARSDVVAREEIEAWCVATFERLVADVARADVAPTGPAGASFSREFFENGRGEVVAFIPTSGAVTTASAIELPAVELAVATAAGPYGDLDRAYGSLGAHVAARGIGAPGPIRERYLIGPDATNTPADYRTEVGWPIDSGAAGGR
ncbi:MAG: MerR family transcriptional regulator [Miltoncostaeaceae bacterium]